VAGAEADAAAGGSVSGPFWPHPARAASIAAPHNPARSAVDRGATTLRAHADCMLKIVAMSSTPTPLTEREYHAQADAVLALIESRVDRWLQDDVIDIDTARVGGMLELTFPTGSKIVVNTQPPLHELWLAARAGGYHFRYVDGRWLDTKDGREFFATLSRAATEQGGRPLKFE
jgi:CyaY protein